MNETNQEVEETVEEVEQVEEVELTEVEKLTQEIEALQLQNKELDNKYHMAYADAQNLSKRAKIDAENLVNSKVTGIVENILPALDNFERALKAEVKDDSVENFLKGFEMIYNQLYQALENEGIKQIECVGHDFDPNYHQSIMQVNDENYESNKVVEEVQKGYTFRNKIIRPAMVKVNE